MDRLTRQDKRYKKEMTEYHHFFKTQPFSAINFLINTFDNSKINNFYCNGTQLCLGDLIEEIRKIIFKLWQYENTELEPQEIIALKEENESLNESRKFEANMVDEEYKRAGNAEAENESLKKRIEVLEMALFLAGERAGNAEDFTELYIERAQTIINKARNNDNINQRELIYKFLDLPCLKQTNILTELNLIDDCDKDKRYVTIMDKIIKKASEGNLINQFWDKIRAK